MKNSVLASRRNFFGALATAVAAPLVPRRVYSFLWDNPLIAIPEIEITVVTVEAVSRKLGLVWCPDGSKREVPLRVSKDGRTETLEFVPEQVGPYRIAIPGRCDFTLNEKHIEGLRNGQPS